MFTLEELGSSAAFGALVVCFLTVIVYACLRRNRLFLALLLALAHSAVVTSYLMLVMPLPYWDDSYLHYSEAILVSSTGRLNPSLAGYHSLPVFSILFSTLAQVTSLGTTLVIPRMYPLFFVLVADILIYCISKELLNSRSGAIVCILITSGSFFFFRDFSPLSLATLLTLVLIYLLARDSRIPDPSQRYSTLILSVILAVAVVLTHVLVPAVLALYLISLSVACVLVKRRTGNSLMPVTLVLVAAYLLWNMYMNIDMRTIVIAIYSDLATGSQLANLTISYASGRYFVTWDPLSIDSRFFLLFSPIAGAIGAAGWARYHFRAKWSQQHTLFTVYIANAVLMGFSLLGLSRSSGALRFLFARGWPLFYLTSALWATYSVTRRPWSRPYLHIGRISRRTASVLVLSALLLWSTGAFMQYLSAQSYLFASQSEYQAHVFYGRVSFPIKEKTYVTQYGIQLYVLTASNKTVRLGYRQEILTDFGEVNPATRHQEFKGPVMLLSMNADRLKILLGQGIRAPTWWIDDAFFNFDPTHTDVNLLFSDGNYRLFIKNS